MTMYETPMFAPQGWQCPICHRVYSPTTPMCFSCGNAEVVTTNKIEVNPATPVRDLMINGGKTEGDAKKCDGYRIELGTPRCYGTKEREECFCDGDRKKCTFYKNEPISFR